MRLFIDFNLKESDPTLGLDQYLYSRGSRIARSLPVDRKENRPQLEGALLGASRSVSCSTCAERNQAYSPCEGVSALQDARLISQGACLSWLRDSFEWVRREVEQIYRHCLHGTLGFRPPTMTGLATESVRVPNDLRNVQFHVGGFTRYEDTASDLESSVRLSFNVRNFSAECLYGIRYVLFHEVFVHAFHGTALRGRQTRQVCSPTHRFFEGWLDWIAAEELAGLLRRQKVPVNIALPRREADVTIHLSNERANYGSNCSEYAMRRAEGREAGRKVLSLLQSKHASRDPNVAFFEVLRLSVKLTSTIVDLDALDDIVYLALFHLVDRPGDRSRGFAAVAARAFLSACETNDVDKLVAVAQEMRAKDVQRYS